MVFRCILFCKLLRFVAGVCELWCRDRKGQAAQQPQEGEGSSKARKRVYSKLNLPTGVSNCCQQNNCSWKRMFLSCPALLVPAVRFEYYFAVIVSLLEKIYILRGAGEQLCKALPA